LSWSFPLNDKVKGYVKYFNGYGETLLDYNHRSNRVSVGFVVADWL
jgi:phospholipase A1